MMGPTAIIAGAKSLINKFVAGLTAYTAFRKPMGFLGDYALAFAFGGLTRGFGSSLNWDNYRYTFFSRAITYGLPGGWKQEEYLVVFNIHMERKNNIFIISNPHII